ncbi:MAG: Thiol:disulfide interchange protein [Candidatus Jettenia ecosi]|uniref:Thiol:disulfide interchange protein n=1 Tax=Candidatus Jettenia ecosi TaxID=2494326 RepID=A0A533Q9Q7_9BACT|nr:MAG: Thiol:disulfide interchange protein [Candidatus Jettenia ecosi]
MRKMGFLILTAITSIFFVWTGCVVTAGELRNDATAAKQLELIRRNLSNLTEMKVADAKKYYEESLKSLNTLIEKYAGTEQELEAKFYIGAIYNEMHTYDEAIKYFDIVLSHEGIDSNFKARSLYFKIKALLGKGDIVKAKETIAELKLIEPAAADSFGSELSGLVRIGAEAPTFSAMDFKGNQIDLSKYRGNIVILDFWATWCDPCLEAFPKVKNMYNKFKDKGVQFIGVSLDDDIENVRGFVKQEKVEWPQLFDGKRWKGVLPGLYRVNIIPTMFVIDRESKIRYMGSNLESATQVVMTLLSESKDVPLFR